MRKSIALLGGDLRQVRLAELFVHDGWDVVTWGLEKGGGQNPVPLDRAMECGILVMPLPVFKGRRWNHPLTDTVIAPDELWKRIRHGQLLLGGMWGTLGTTIRQEYGLEPVDYYEREDVQITNAVPTAEGAIMRMMEETEYTVQDSRCLVLGYGRIGKLLASKLKALGSDVTIAARKNSDLAWIKAYGMRAVAMCDVLKQPENFDVIFNTVPACVLDEERIKNIKPGTLLVELASSPGGFDKNAVKGNCLQIIEEPGIPGKVAPLSAAKTMQNAIVEILRERGETV